MFDEAQKEFDKSVRTMAENSLLKKLNKQGLQRVDLSDEKFNELLLDEIEILKADGKKVGAGVGIGIVLSLITGGIF
ncbi:MAG: hypothetical protein PHN18_10430 [Sulfurospirillaceae bacterium]|nr:hypothetical protein [Sulfurospirillaceae bacterium]MDD2827444.1 hypothetical protein [Sulfurospirillaceae bacterium]